MLDIIGLIYWLMLVIPGTMVLVYIDSKVDDD